jgi:hypothetical protein
LKLKLLLIVCGICLSLTACVSDAPGKPTAASAAANDAKVKKSQETASIEGTIQIKKAFTRTLSEYSYFVIVSDAGKETILFNSKDFSGGFGEWTGKKVIVHGKSSKGKVGFKKTIMDGFKVESIESLDG